MNLHDLELGLALCFPEVHWFGQRVTGFWTKIIHSSCPLGFRKCFVACFCIRKSRLLSIQTPTFVNIKMSLARTKLRWKWREKKHILLCNYRIIILNVMGILINLFWTFRSSKLLFLPMKLCLSHFKCPFYFQLQSKLKF
jgi:hypothetical protein